MQGAMQSMSATQEPPVSPPLPSRDTTPVANNSLGSNASAHSAATAGHRTKHRPLPTNKGRLIRTTESSKKRKHTSKSSRAERQYGDSGSEEGGEMSGDGSSSGDSISSQASVRQKRRRTSRIATRSSTRIANMEGASTSEGPMDIDISSAGDTPSVEGEGATLTDSDHVGTDDLIVTNRHVPTDTNSPVTTDTDDRATPNTDDRATADAEDCAAANTDDRVTPNTDDRATANAEDCTATNTNDRVTTGDPATTNADNPALANMTATNAKDPTLTSSENLATVGTGLSTVARSAFSSASMGDINEESVPAFLLRHGKGKREVNIFDYLGKVQDLRFQQVFYHYLCFEINNKSKAAGSLPTTNWPVEIGQWSSRARPASLPDYTKDRWSLTHFTDSVFEWWARIQPHWRKFKRSKVSHEVRGEWDALRATGINGLLNVVVLAYWWIRILEEDKPEDGVHAEYEFFAEDVAWAPRNLASMYV